MNKLHIVIALLCFLLAVTIFIFAEGARAIYSGVFFAILGAVVTWTALRNAKRNAS